MKMNLIKIVLIVFIACKNAPTFIDYFNILHTQKPIWKL